MLPLRVYILLILFGEVLMLLKKNYKARIISLGYSGGADYANFSHVRFTGRERYLSGTVEFKKNLGDDIYSLSAESFIDSNGNGEYKLFPMFAPRQPICKGFATCWKYVNASIKYGVNTDFPGRFNPCPIPKGIYYIKNVAVNTDDWPLIMPRGFFKGEATLYDGNEVAGKIIAIVEITDLS